MSKISYFVFSFLILTTGLHAQAAQGPTTSFTRVYFLMLLFAVIINRLLEYLKILLLLIDEKWKILSPLNDFFSKRIEKNLEHLNVAVPSEELKKKSSRLLLSSLMQFLGFTLGVAVSALLKLNAMVAFELPIPGSIGIFITGIVIGAGVEPIHTFFRIAQEKRKIKKILIELKDRSG